MNSLAIVLCKTAIVDTMGTALKCTPNHGLRCSGCCSKPRHDHQQRCQPGHVECPHVLPGPVELACILRLQYVAGVSSLCIAGTTLYVAPLAMAGAVVAAAAITYVTVRAAVKLAWLVMGLSSGASLPITTISH